MWVVTGRQLERLESQGRGKKQNITKEKIFSSISTILLQRTPMPRTTSLPESPKVVGEKQRDAVQEVSPEVREHRHTCTRESFHLF
jgi:hypothetical protein